MATGDGHKLAIRADDDRGDRGPDPPARRARGRPKGKVAGKAAGPKKPAEIHFDDGVLLWLNVHASATKERRSALVNRLAAAYLKQHGVHQETYRRLLPDYLEDGKTEAA